MGFLDKIKQQATEAATAVAEKTQETAKLTQLNASLKGLRNEERDAFAEFGRLAYGLHEQHALAERSGELAGPAAKLADVQQRIAAKEAEIAEVKGASGASGDSVESVAEEDAAEPAAPAPGEE
jgi:hypothetical protein